MKKSAFAISASSRFPCQRKKRNDLLSGLPARPPAHLPSPSRFRSATNSRRLATIPRSDRPRHFEREKSADRMGAGQEHQMEDCNSRPGLVLACGREGKDLFDEC